ncbi:MAG: HNH endonuclease signature motif containing protein [Patescibacteria group bacterium]|nr:HNH endonuclease signature motif containing protein [Patescibacteria group bacterium]
MVRRECQECKKEFNTKPSQLKLGFGKYCSMGCSRQAQKTGKFVLCYTCEKPTWKTPKDLKKSKSGYFFCGKSCQTLWRNKKYTGKNHPNWQGGEFSYHRIMKEHNISAECKECGMSNKKVLVIHHVDHNRKNNTIANLMWLCRNCHYLIHNGKTF